ncbi:MAG: ABC-2 transporter permease [Olsenella sp.]|jgi:hypothetical protein|nr:ABC-2 transporter permease [Olsenella sp.]
MRGLMLRDALVLLRRVSLARIAVLLVGGILFMLFMRIAAATLLSVMFPLLAGGMMSILAAEDDKTNWLKFVRASPARVWDVVVARYLVCGIILLATCVYTTLLNVACFLLFREQPLAVYLGVSAVGALVAYSNILLMVPSCFGGGASGANLVSMVVLFAAGAFAWVVRNVDLTGVLTFLASVPMYAYVLVGVAAMLLATVLSVCISMLICRKKTIY